MLFKEDDLGDDERWPEIVRGDDLTGTALATERVAAGGVSEMFFETRGLADLFY